MSGVNVWDLREIRKFAAEQTADCDREFEMWKYFMMNTEDIDLVNYAYDRAQQCVFAKEQICIVLEFLCDNAVIDDYRQCVALH